MAANLQIWWDGDAPGLKEHRLSVDAFAGSLDLLQKAMRRIASGLLSEALDDAEYGARGGRFAKQSQYLDLEIEAIKEGSLGLSLVCRARLPPGAEGAMLDRLVGQTAERLIDDIEAESKGQARNAMVRKYLASLPAGIEKQRYTAVSEGRPPRETTFARAKIAEVPKALPSLAEIDANVVGLTFLTGRGEVKLKDGDGTTWSCSATDEQVEQALLLRHRLVRAMVLAPAMGTARLLWIRDLQEPARTLTSEQVTDHIFTRWDEVLRRLSK